MRYVVCTFNAAVANGAPRYVSAVTGTRVLYTLAFEDAQRFDSESTALRVARRCGGGLLRAR